MIPSPLPDGERTPLAPTAVHLIHDGRLGERCAGLLREVGVAVTTAAAPGAGAAPALPALPDGAVLVLATDRPRPKLALELDEAAWEAGVAWTSATIVAHEFRVGPSVVPGRTPCFGCFARRVRAVAPDPEAHDALEAFARSGDAPWFLGRLTPLTEQVAALLAAEALAFSGRVRDGGQSGPRLGLVWEGDATQGGLVARRFARSGLCSRCAPGEHAAGRASSLADYFAAHPLATSAAAAARGGGR